MRSFLFLLLACSMFFAQGAYADTLAQVAGGAAPELRLRDLAGGEYDLADYRGKVVLVNFWATWCEPCRDEMPALEKLARTFADRPFAVLAVNVDEPESRIRKFLSRFPLNLPVLLDPGRRTTKAWNVRLMPSTFVIDPGGRIRYAVAGEIDWASSGVAERIARLFPGT